LEIVLGRPAKDGTPQATKNLSSPLIGLFSFVAWQGSAPLVSDIPIKNRPLKGQIKFSSLYRLCRLKRLNFEKNLY
jgi:hypothetical protein